MQTKSPAAQLLEQALSEEKMMDEPNVLSYEEGESVGAEELILKERVIEEIRTVYDPEIPINIYELGLIYKLDVDAARGHVDVEMTLTSPACPVAGTLPPEVENKIASVPGVNTVNVELVWDPPYSIEMMSEAARLQLGLY